jgi:hypothetical protein
MEAAFGPSQRQRKQERDLAGVALPKQSVTQEDIYGDGSLEVRIPFLSGDHVIRIVIACCSSRKKMPH